jgi:cell division septum initiation protein DivIVA
LWHDGVVATTDPNVDALLAEVRKAAAAVGRAERVLEQRRAELAATIGKAAKGGAKPTALVQASGKSTETIRQISREHGVARLRPPTRGGFPAAAQGKPEEA